MATATGSATLSVVYLTTPVMTSATRMYSTVQITNEPRMPIGISRWGLRDSCAAVETASNPRYAKKTTAAPLTTPDHPNSPNLPVLGGTKGVQFAAFTNAIPNPI